MAMKPRDCHDSYAIWEICHGPNPSTGEYVSRIAVQSNNRLSENFELLF